MLAAAAAVVSCSKDYTIVADQGEAIAFNSFVDNATRATDPSYKATTLAYFDVYGAVGGVNIFDGDQVERDGADLGAPWTMDSSAPKQYWIAGANYVFDAVVDATNVVVDSTTGLPTELEYSASTQKDMLHNRVTTTGKPQTNDGIVSFNFTHLLSKVNFTVTNEDKDAVDYSFVVKNINFAGNVTGVYNVASGAWDGTKFTTGNTALGNARTVESTTVKDIVVDSGAASNELGTEVLFLPGEYKITFTVDILYKGNVITTTNYPTDATYYEFTLAQNNAYNFNVTVAVGDLIQFTATTMSDWVNGNTNDTDGDTTNDSVVLQ